MEEYLKLLDMCSKNLQQEIHYEKDTGWNITIRDNEGTLICDVGDKDMKPCFEKAYEAVRKWKENEE